MGAKSDSFISHRSLLVIVFSFLSGPLDPAGISTCGALRLWLLGQWMILSDEKRLAL
jgi:hypothetical protein